MRQIVFAYNPTSWRDGKPIPGGMADCLIHPILEALHPTDLRDCTNRPKPGAVNCYFTHRRTYGLRAGPPREVSVFVSHGIADKVWRNARRMLGHFDYVAVSGPAWSKRLTDGGYPPDRVLEVGYTKLDPIFQGRIPTPARDGRVRVVWAPTHGGGGEGRAAGPPTGSMLTGPSSWWHRNKVLELLAPSEFDVVIAPHPRHRPDKRATLTEYVGADVVIADGGSTIYEAWALGLPVVFPTWLTERGNLRREKPGSPTFEAAIYRNRLGVHAIKPAELAELVAKAAVDGIGERERTFVEQVLPAAYRGSSGRRHAEALVDIAHNRPPRHAKG